MSYARHPGPPPRPYAHIPRQRHPVPYYPYPPRPRRRVGRTLLWITLWIVALGVALVGGYFGALSFLS